MYNSVQHIIIDTNTYVFSVTKQKGTEIYLKYM